MKINIKAVVIALTVLIVILAGFYFGGYFKPENIAATNEPVTKTTEPVAETITAEPSTTNKTETTNTTNKTMNTTPSTKVNIVVLKEGSGAVTKNGDKLTVNYVGTLTNGTKFDSSIDSNTPFVFTLGAGRVIKGWDEGMLGMKVGEERKLTIPADLAYGAQSPSPLIPANSILVFDVTLLKIN